MAREQRSATVRRSSRLGCIVPALYVGASPQVPHAAPVAHAALSAGGVCAGPTGAAAAPTAAARATVPAPALSPTPLPPLAPPSTPTPVEGASGWAPTRGLDGDAAGCDPGENSAHRATGAAAQAGTPTTAGGASTAPAAAGGTPAVAPCPPPSAAATDAAAAPRRRCAVLLRWLRRSWLSWSQRET